MSLLAQAKQIAQHNVGARIASRFPADPDELDRIIAYKPRPLQQTLDENERRFNAEVMHRRFGKTVLKCRKLINRAAFCPFPDGRYAYTAPTYQMAEDIAWMYLKGYQERLLEHLGEPDAEKYQNASKLFLWVPTKRGDMARIRLYGVDNPKQRMRGLYLDGVVNDEWALSPMSVWSEQMRPMLSDENRAGADEFGRQNQWADFIFTPAGRNHAHTMFRKAEAWARGESVIERDKDTGEETEVKRDDWFAALYKASDTGYVAEQELEDALRDMGRSKYEQEFECSFDAAVEGAIFARELELLRARGQIKRVPYNPLVPVHTAWDLGWDDATALWFVQQAGDAVNVIDYYEASGAGLDHYADVMANKGYRYGWNFLPHDVEVTELGSGKDRATILRSFGVRVTTVPRVKVKSDAIAAGQALLPRAYFDAERCALGLDRLALYRREFNEKLQVMRQNPVHDWASHGADAWMTLALGLRQYRPSRPDPNNQRVAEM